jgi:hypothetical protein
MSYDQHILIIFITMISSQLPPLQPSHFNPICHFHLALIVIGDAWSEIRDEFKSRAIFRMKEQLIEDSAIQDILDNLLLLKLMHFDHLTGAPTQVVSQLMLSGYTDNFDYFYQVISVLLVVCVIDSLSVCLSVYLSAFLPQSIWHD